MAQRNVASTANAMNYDEVVLVDKLTGAAVPSGTSGSPMVYTPQGLGNLATNQITVAATATLIVAARASRAAVTITMIGNADVFIGGSGVTTANGALLTGTKGTSITLPTTAAIYGIVATATQAVSFVETY